MFIFGGLFTIAAWVLLLILVPLLRVDTIVRWSDSLGVWFRQQAESIGADSGRFARWFAKPLLLVMMQIDEWTEGLENHYFRAAIRLFLYINIFFAAIWVALFVIVLLAVIALAVIIIGLVGKGSGEGRQEDEKR